MSVLTDPELDSGLPVGSHQSRVEGKNPLPQPAGHISFDAAQHTVGLLSCERILPGHVKLLVNQHSPVLLLGAALNPFSSQSVLVLGIPGPCTWPYLYHGSLNWRAMDLMGGPFGA